MKRMAWALAALMAVAAALPTAARAGIGAFGTWWDSNDYGDMYGGGGKLALGLAGGFWIEASDGFVEENQAFGGAEGPGQEYALLLAPRKFAKARFAQTFGAGERHAFHGALPLGPPIKRQQAVFSLE